MPPKQLVCQQEYDGKAQYPLLFCLEGLSILNRAGGRRKISESMVHFFSEIKQWVV